MLLLRPYYQQLVVVPHSMGIQQTVEDMVLVTQGQQVQVVVVVVVTLIIFPVVQAHKLYIVKHYILADTPGALVIRLNRMEEAVVVRVE